jgi:predicted membrane protein
MPEEKRYKTEWSFSFDRLGQDIGQFVKSLGGDGEETVKQAEFVAPIEGATGAQVRIDFAIGEAVIRALTNLDNLIEADLTYVGDVNFVVNGEGAGERIIALSQKSAPADWVRNMLGWIGSQGKLRWDIGLATQVPLHLEVHTGVGEAKLNLREMTLVSAAVYSGAGEVHLTLPEQSEHYTVNVNCGVGETELDIPAGANVTLSLRGGAGEVDLRIGEGANVTAEITGGVGECDMILPINAAARFEAETGIGEIRLPARFQRLSGDDTFINSRGIWETADYATAERKITVRYKGGVGELKVR